MTPITVHNLKNNGFVLQHEYPNLIIFTKEVNNWNFLIELNKINDFCSIKKMALEADGFSDYAGYYDLDHFYCIEQFDNLILALNGEIKQ